MTNQPNERFMSGGSGGTAVARDLFGVVAAMQGKGGKLVAKNHIVNPSTGLKNKLRTSLQSRYRLKYLPSKALATGVQTAADVSELHSSANVVLEQTGVLRVKCQNILLTMVPKLNWLV